METNTHYVNKVPCRVAGEATSPDLAALVVPIMSLVISGSFVQRELQDKVDWSPLSLCMLLRHSALWNEFGRMNESIIHVGSCQGMQSKHVHELARVHVCVCVCVRMRVHACWSDPHTHTLKCTPTHTYKHSLTHSLPHTQTHADTHTHKRTHIHTHTHT